MRTKALTIRPPWAQLIIMGVKDVENRSWKTDYRGPIAIHMGTQVSVEHLEMASATLEHIGIDLMGALFDPRSFPAGHVLGTVELVDCVKDSSSPWAIADQWHWVLDRPQAFTPEPVKGKLGLWEYEWQS